MKTFWIVVLVIVGLAIYFNIGYWVGGYFYTHTQDQKPDTFWAKFLIGGWEVLQHFGDKNEIIAYSSIFWPIGLVITLGSWFFYGIFGGGLFELIGIFFAIDPPVRAITSFILTIFTGFFSIFTDKKWLWVLTVILFVCFIEAF